MLNIVRIPSRFAIAFLLTTLALLMSCSQFIMSEDATIELLAPDSDSLWEVGRVDSAVIRWSQEGVIGNIHIELHRNGVYHSTIAPVVNVFDYHYSWTVPATVEPGRGYQVYIEHNVEAAVNSMGSTFDIDPYDTDRQLTVTSPKTGDKWQIAQQDAAVIQWGYANLDGQIRIALYQGIEWVADIADSVDITSANVTWTVPLSVPEGTDYRVYVESLADPYVGAYGPAFQVLPSATPVTLTVTKPVSNDRWKPGFVNGAAIAWTYTVLDGTIRADLFRNDTLITEIVDSVDVTEQSYAWTVPQTIAADRGYQVYIQSNQYPRFEDYSASFRIDPYDTTKVLDVVKPDGNSTWVISSPDDADIQWKYANIDGLMQIDLYDSRSLVGTIADDVNLEAGGYTWTVPDSIPEGTRYSVKLLSKTFPGVTGESAQFSIVDMASIASLDVTAPLSGDVWIRGASDEAEIAWTSAYLPGTLRIDLYDGRNLAATIAENVDVLDGSYTWTAPDTLPEGTGYTIVLTSSEYPTVTGESAAFTIADIVSVASLEVNEPSSGATWVIDLLEGAHVGWYSEYLTGTLLIELLDSRNTVLAVVADQVNVAQGSYTWTVPDTIPAGSRNTVRITSNEYPAVTAESATFDIADMASVANLDIVHPARNSTWTIGQANGAQVEWAYEYLTGYLRIDLIQQSSVIATITDSVAVTQNVYTWTVPDSIVQASNYQVYLESLSYPDVNATSGRFSISP